LKTKTITFNEEELKIAIRLLLLSKSDSASYEDYLKANKIIDLLQNTPYND
jgi:hypothetical protein